jgi:large subunit ribosomal protein L3|tara:strand:- start:13344 stop:13982 length:639 start_codon:yes stop_codon:yes gene_type:complete
MTTGIVGRKSGMTRIFADDGRSIPVTVVEAAPNRITQVKTVDADGYSAVQVTTGERRASRVTNSQAGIFSKANVDAGRGLWELRIEDESAFEVGSNLTVESFEEGQIVDVTGISKGKGFAGVIKRWNFAMQDATHGNSVSHRAPGSIGQNQTPGRVFKGKKMAGHMGAEQVTIQNLEIIRVDAERNLLLIKGSVPGMPGGDVIVRSAVKAKA